MDMVPVLNMSVDRRVKQRDNTQTRQCKCVYRKEKHFIRYLQEYLCAWLCVCGRKKIVESMNVSNDTKHRKIMNT